MPKQWFNIEMSKEEFSLFRTILKIKDIEYEPSECGDLVHVEVYCTEQDAYALNRTHAVLMENLITR